MIESHDRPHPDLPADDSSQAVGSLLVRQGRLPRGPPGLADKILISQPVMPTVWVLPGRRYPLRPHPNWPRNWPTPVTERHSPGGTIHQTLALSMIPREAVPGTRCRSRGVTATIRRRKAWAPRRPLVRATGSQCNLSHHRHSKLSCRRRSGRHRCSRSGFARRQNAMPLKRVRVTAT